jgi:hypothetical protein
VTDPEVGLGVVEPMSPESAHSISCQPLRSSWGLQCSELDHRVAAQPAAGGISRHRSLIGVPHARRAHGY